MHQGRHPPPLIILMGVIMKIEIIKKCFNGTIGNMMAGQEYDVDKKIAEKLIDRGYAKKASAKKKTVKLENRQMTDDEIETPEAE